MPLDNLVFVLQDENTDEHHLEFARLPGQLWSRFTDEQLSALSGQDGADGADGQDGRHVTDVSVAATATEATFTFMMSSGGNEIVAVPLPQGPPGNDSTVPGPQGRNVSNVTVVPSGNNAVFTFTMSSGEDITATVALPQGEQGAPGQDGINGQDGADGQDSTVPGPPGPPGGQFNWSTTSESVTLSHGQAVGVDTTAGEVTVTLPASPSDGDTVKILDTHGQFGTNKVTVARNGATIMQLDEDLDVTTNFMCIELVYLGTNWSIT